MAAEAWNLLNQALSSGSRSTVLKSLGWLIALASAGAISSMTLTGTNWLTVIFGIFLVLSGALYLAAYVFFALKDPDALRSETFSIRKLEIERGYRGDDSAGFIPPQTSRVLVDSNEKLRGSLSSNSDEAQS